jgi:hypothetical protein
MFDQDAGFDPYLFIILLIAVIAIFWIKRLSS